MADGAPDGESLPTALLQQPAVDDDRQLVGKVERGQGEGIGAPGDEGHAPEGDRGPDGEDEDGQRRRRAERMDGHSLQRGAEGSDADDGQREGQGNSEPALDEGHVRFAGDRQVVGDGCSDDAAADDHEPRGGGQGRSGK